MSAVPYEHNIVSAAEALSMLNSSRRQVEMIERLEQEALDEAIDSYVPRPAPRSFRKDRIACDEIMSRTAMRDLIRSIIDDEYGSYRNFHVTEEAVEALRAYYCDMAARVVDEAVKHRNARRKNDDYKTLLTPFDLLYGAKVTAAACAPNLLRAIEQRIEGITVAPTRDADEELDDSERSHFTE